MLTLFASLKIGELCALKWSDIDFGNGVIMISKTLQRIFVGEKTELFLSIEASAMQYRLQSLS